MVFPTKPAFPCGLQTWISTPRTVFRTRCNLMRTMGSMAITVTIRLTATQFAGGRKTGMVGPLTQVGFFQLTGWSTGPRFASKLLPNPAMAL